MYIGTDPECHIQDTTGRTIPAYKLGIPDKGSKVKNGVGTASWFFDNYSVEFNTTRPYTCIEDVYSEISRGKQKLQRVLGKQYRIVAVAGVKVNPQQDLVQAPFEMMRFGCKPDYCAYELKACVPEINAMEHDERYGGGHLHMSTDNIESGRFIYPYCHPNEAILLNPDNYPEIAKKADKYLGLAAAYIWKDDEWQWRRRKYYGQAGRFRPQIYPRARVGYRAWGEERSEAMGIEYRTLPPQIFNTLEIAELFMGAFRWMVHNWDKLPYDPSWDDCIREAIDTGHGIDSLVHRVSVPKIYDFDKLNALRLQECAKMRNN